MPHKKIIEPTSHASSNRIATRPKNANTHPGTMAQNALRVRRTKEEIQQEKELKKAKKEAKEIQKIADEAKKVAGEEYVAERELEEAAATANAGEDFPRKRLRRRAAKGNADIPSNNTANTGNENRATISGDLQVAERPKSKNQTRRAGVPRPIPRPISEASQIQGPNSSTQCEEADVDIDVDTTPRKVKVNTSRSMNQPLRRTETTLESTLLHEKRQESQRYRLTSEDLTDIEMEDEEKTPRPMEHGNYHQLSDMEKSDEPFKTPLILRNKKTQKRIVYDRDDFSGSEHPEEKGKQSREGKNGRKEKEQTSRQADNLRNVGEYHIPDNNELEETPIPFKRKLASVEPEHQLEADKKRKRDKVMGEKQDQTMGKQDHVSGPEVEFTAFPKKINFATAFKTCSSSHRSTCTDSGVRRDCGTVPHSQSAFGDVSTKKSAASNDSAESLRDPPRPSRSASEFTIPPRTTASNGIVAFEHVVSKASKVLSRAGQAVGPSSRDSVKDDENFKPANSAAGGLHDEDDSLEQMAAMSSPLKGSEQRVGTKALVKAKSEQEDKRHKRAVIQNLPEGANEENAWTRQVIPNFVNIILTGEQPWLITDNTIISELQNVWNHVYGSRVPFTIEKRSIPFELAVQKLSEYRNILACKAVSAVFAYFCAQFDDDVNLKDDGPELAEFAKDLLSKPKHGFVFKGMENTLNPTKTGTFRHTLILETLSAHFSTITQGQPLLGIKIGEPQLSIALAAAATERALQLFANRMVEERSDGRGRKKFFVQRSHNTNTGVQSGFLSEFSAAGWNKVTIEYLKSIKGLGDARMKKIISEAREISMGKKREIIDKPMSGRSNLHSDEENLPGQGTDQDNDDFYA